MLTTTFIHSRTMFLNILGGKCHIRCSSVSLERSFSVIKIPFSGGQPIKGTELGPDNLIGSDILSHIPQGVRNMLTVELSDLDNGRSIEGCSAAAERVAKIVHEESRKGNFCLNFGGDHSVATGTVAGMLKTYPNMGVIWIDAHADINTPETSPSMNVHGMALSFLCSFLRDQINLQKYYQWLTDYPQLDCGSICYVGLRSVDEGERKIIDEFGLKSYYATDIEQRGITAIVREILENFKKLNKEKLFVSFDVDSLDPVYAPSTGTRVSGGLTTREAMTIGSAIGGSGKLVGLDIVEVNPLIGTKDELKVTNESSSAVLRSFTENFFS